VADNLGFCEMTTLSLCYRLLLNFVYWIVLTG